MRSDLDRAPPADPAIPRGDDEHGDRATPLWITELGWGSAPPDRFGINKGLDGSTADALRLLRDDPEPPQRLERAAPLLVPVARSARRAQRSRAGAASAAARGSCATTAPRSPPTPRSGASRPRRPRPWRASPRGQAREASPRTRPRASPSPRTRPARPSSASSTQAPSTAAARRYPLAPLSDGPHTFYVKAIDAPGNESPVVSRSFTVDTVAPAVAISSGPAEGSTSSDPSPSFSFASNDSGASFSCRLDGGGFHACDSPFSASGLADGPHTSRSGQRIGPKNSRPSPPAPGPSTPRLRR